MSEREDTRDDGPDPDAYETPEVEDLEAEDGLATTTAAGLTLG
jgi:hypothetical protein